MFATSPLAAMRSAPTTTWLTSPPASSDAALESVTRRWGIPARASSQAVSREPCSRGLVSHTHTSTSRPLSHAERNTPAAVPYAPVASGPGVAVRERRVAGRESLRSDPGEGAVGGRDLRLERLRASDQRHRRVVAGGERGLDRLPLALERPTQVHGGRARAGQERGGVLESHPHLLARALVARGRQGHAVGGRQPDRRRPAHRHRVDRAGHMQGGLAPQPPLLGRQGALVEHQQRSALPAQGQRLHYQPRLPGPPLNGPWMSLVIQPP